MRRGWIRSAARVPSTVNVLIGPQGCVDVIAGGPVCRPFAGCRGSAPSRGR
jgi:hypothetical protein